MKLTFLVIIGFLLSSQLVQAQDWSNDFSEAKQLSLEKDLPILLVFSGSDWCAPCIKLEKNVWMSEYFINYAPEHYILLKADFPKRKQNALSLEKQRENDELAKQFNPNGHFPLVVLLNSNAEVLKVIGYETLSAEEYIALLNSKP